MKNYKDLLIASGINLDEEKDEDHKRNLAPFMSLHGQ